MTPSPASPPPEPESDADRPTEAEGRFDVEQGPFASPGSPADGRDDAALAADDVLPPVEPPNAGFILQLFVIPALIVAIFGLGYLGVQWMIQSGGDPSDYVELIQRNNASSWQAAHDLVTLLARDDELKSDHNLAGQLTRLLQTRLDTPLPTDRTRENEIQLRVFLCHALGEFRLAEPRDVLVEAAGLDVRDDALAIRRAAIEALAVQHSHLPESEVDRTAVTPVLLEAASHDDARIRLPAAYALGVVGGEEARLQLREMLTDTNLEVRYNAATGLARHGDAASLGVLEQMLDPEQTAAIEGETPAYQQQKRATILINALRAIDQLAAANPDANLAQIVPAIEALSDADFGGQLPGDSARAIHEQAATLAEALGG